MEKGKVKKIKFLITIVIILGFVWFLILSPMITFHRNEKKLEAAAKRYFELNSRELPTGERIKTIGLNTLYHKSFIEGDLYIPYTHKTCSIENSWVKVKRVNNEYKYYTYLECGILSSTIDHKGPDITLNGNNSITVGKGEKYTDMGVRSVVDNVDGKLNVKDVTIKGSVDTSKIGTYEIKYIAFDSLKNKTEVVREVKVVQKLDGTIKSTLKDKKNFKGMPENNYIRLSNQLFRVYGLTNDYNVIVVADEDIANVNYSKLDEWLDYYYRNLNDITKKMIVETKFCNMSANESNINSTKCSNYTKKKKIYIPSVVEVNKAQDGEKNFMKPNTISWVANSKGDGKEAYVTRNVFFYEEAGKDFIPYEINDNYGVRPMFTIKGNSLISGGTGTIDDPYVFGDSKKAKGGTLLNERYTGEYVSIDGKEYRIVSVENDGTTKVISNFTINDKVQASGRKNKIVYNPKDKNSAAYYINNKVGKYVDSSYFINHQIDVPIYKNKIIYGKEIDTKKYKAVFSAPNMYEMFSAQPQNFDTNSYWMCNTSNGERITGAMYDIGVPINERIESFTELQIRFVGYLKKDTVISSGNGTLDKPYILK